MNADMAATQGGQVAGTAGVGENVFLTGATGFLGSEIMKRILEEHPRSKLALLVRSQNFVASKLLNRAWILLIISGSLALATESLHARWIVFTFTALASSSFIYVSLFSAEKWLQKVMTNRFLIYSGTISYGLYLLHKISFGAVQALHLDRHPSLPFPFIFAASYALAALSWNLLEKPSLSLNRFFVPRPIQVAAFDGHPQLEAPKQDQSNH